MNQHTTTYDGGARKQIIGQEEEAAMLVIRLAVAWHIATHRYVLGQRQPGQRCQRQHHQNSEDTQHLRSPVTAGGRQPSAAPLP